MLVENVYEKAYGSITYLLNMVLLHQNLGESSKTKTGGALVAILRLISGALIHSGLVLTTTTKQIRSAIFCVADVTSPQGMFKIASFEQSS